MKGKKKLDKSVYQSLTLISQFGLNMLVPICMMLWLGLWLDQKLGTSFLGIVFFFLGAIAGFQNIYRMARKVSDGGKTADEERISGGGKTADAELGSDGGKSVEIESISDGRKADVSKKKVSEKDNRFRDRR